MDSHIGKTFPLPLISTPQDSYTSLSLSPQGFGNYLQLLLLPGTQPVGANYLNPFNITLDDFNLVSKC